MTTSISTILARMQARQPYKNYRQLGRELAARRVKKAAPVVVDKNNYYYLKDNA